MKYLCLIYTNETKLQSMPEDELDAVAHECREHLDTLRRSGQLVAAERLESVRTAAIVRVRDGKPVVTDGPFLETKEQLGGFYLIEAGDMNDAVRIAAKIPPGRLGFIEVRPVME
jgi:hypothetical protein